MDKKIVPKIRTGMCKCGHSWEEHHLGMVLNTEAMKVYAEYDSPLYVPQECEHYGSNEAGGLKYDEENDVWVAHCFGYEEDPNAEDQRTWRERT